jgi:hypothetical protein
MSYQDNKHYNCEVTVDGKIFKVHANQIHNADDDHFQGWTCYAGCHRINIDEDGKVWSGMCNNDYLGTVDDWKLLPAPTVCNQSRCNGCTDDLIVEKYQTILTSVP